MASARDTASFFTKGTSNQFEHVLKLYPQALKLKADKKTKKPEELIKLDNWYQNELPKRIKARGKDGHMTHEELVQTMKWKQARGKFFPQLSYLIKVNTPRAVMLETKKAFRKLPNLEQAITALSNLKGVGTTMASALLAAAAPDKAPFMADECLMAIPEIEGIDYTTKEYLNFVQHIHTVVERLNRETSNGKWNPHKVELALWTHFIASEMAPELLDNIPAPAENGAAHSDDEQNGVTPTNTQEQESSNDSTTQDSTNGNVISCNEDSMDNISTPILASQGDENTNDSIATSDSATNDSTMMGSLNKVKDDIDDENSCSLDEPPSKKTKVGDGK